jgi:hypothetical protein
MKVALSTIHLDGKLAPEDDRWGAFNASFVNKDLPVIDFAEAVWHGAAFTTWHAKRWRVTENFILGQHLALDFDTQTSASSIDALLQDDFVSSYAAFLYSTPSHTDDAPRSRVVFCLDKPIFQAKNYVLAVQSLIALFGGVPDRVTHDAVRFFYGAGLSPEAAYPGKTLPLSMVKAIINLHKDYLNKPVRRKKKHKKRQGQHPIESALDALDPWSINYLDWVQCLMAIHAYDPSPAGLALAESWAQGKKGEVAAKWRSFKNRTDGITENTIFYYARRAGWKPES